MRALRRSLGALLVVAGLAGIAEWGYLAAKGSLAEWLIGRAFERHLGDGEQHRPWAWADHAPIARLELLDGSLRRHVLSGASGSSMAFGIGHVDGSAAPNAPGNCVLAGHRDSWLRFLRGIGVGDRFRLRTRDRSVTYRVARVRVVEERDTAAMEPTGDTRLTVATCYPFDAVTRADRRIVFTLFPEAPG